MANADQVAQWEGGEGEHFAAWQDRYDSLYAPITERLLAAAAVRPGERVLDVGCGCGPSTLPAAAAAAPGEVVGVDLSGPMLAEAARRAEAAGLANVRLLKADAQVHPFPAGSFDVVLSRFGIMYFDDPPAAFANLAGALRPGGRLAACCFQDPLRNRWVTVPARAVVPHLGRPPAEHPDRGPFSLRDPDAVAALLGGAGFADVRVDGVVAAGTLGTVDDAVAFVQANSILRAAFESAPPDRRAAAVDALRAALARHLTSDGVALEVAAWLVTATKH